MVDQRSHAQVAQSVEQWTENPRVGGSIPPLGTIFMGLRPIKMIPTGKHHALTLRVEFTQHFGLGLPQLINQRQTANPGSIPPLGTNLQKPHIGVFMCPTYMQN